MEQDRLHISGTGLVTAVANGTVTARATAADGSGVYGTLDPYDLQSDCSCYPASLLQVQAVQPL